MRKLKNWIRTLVPERIKQFLVYSEEVEYGTISFSQHGEDLTLRSFLEDRPGGFYVDVGAHAPIRFSNTYLFYKKGWRGINIEPVPGSKLAFDLKRPRDINLEVGISDQPGVQKYYSFSEPLLNTFSADIAVVLDKTHPVQHELEIEVSTLKEVLDQFLPPNQPIDFLSVDTERYDLKVLKSNDWEKYRPELVVVEAANHGTGKSLGRLIEEFMSEQKYKLIATGFNVLFFSSK